MHIVGRWCRFSGNGGIIWLRLRIRISYNVDFDLMPRALNLGLPQRPNSKIEVYLIVRWRIVVGNYLT